MLEAGGAQVSHGICKDCMVALIAEHRPRSTNSALQHRRIGSPAPV